MKGWGSEMLWGCFLVIVYLVDFVLIYRRIIITCIHQHPESSDLEEVFLEVGVSSFLEKIRERHVLQLVAYFGRLSVDLISHWISRLSILFSVLKFSILHF